jgi:hypothetical protein
LMGNAEIFISFLANLLICGSKHVTLNQRVQGSSPCAPTNKYKYLSSLFDVAQTPRLPYLSVRTMSANRERSPAPLPNLLGPRRERAALE